MISLGSTPPHRPPTVPPHDATLQHAHEPLIDKVQDNKEEKKGKKKQLRARAGFGSQLDRVDPLARNRVEVGDVSFYFPLSTCRGRGSARCELRSGEATQSSAVA